MLTSMLWVLLWVLLSVLLLGPVLVAVSSYFRNSSVWGSTVSASPGSAVVWLSSQFGYWVPVFLSCDERCAAGPLFDHWLSCWMFSWSCFSGHGLDVGSSVGFSPSAVNSSVHSALCFAISSVFLHKWRLYCLIDCCNLLDFYLFFCWF